MTDRVSRGIQKFRCRHDDRAGVPRTKLLRTRWLLWALLAAKISSNPTRPDNIWIVPAECRREIGRLDSEQ
jgi:hypothetical protein